VAIDSAEKRKSVAGITLLWGPGVTPNVAKDAEWRQQAGYGYSGISAGAVVVTVGNNSQVFRFEWVWDLFDA
jgi:hypothetical protein